MKVLIVDDEPLARRRLRRMLARVSGVEIAGEAGDAGEARAQVAALKPDLLLLDIHMPEENGLELMATTPELPPVIFTTAYDEHAVKAFELAAIDYLLKPIEEARLAKALSRARERIGAKATDLVQLIDRLSGSQRVRITARSGQRVLIIDAAEIARFSATDKYVVFHHGSEELILDESLNRLEERLNNLPFLRVHRSELINLDRVRALRHEDGETFVELEGGQRARVSRRNLAALQARLGVK
jgi:two-component system, LytTR family, response regulator